MKILYELAKHNAHQRRLIEALLPIKLSTPIRKLYNLLYSQNELNDNQAMLEIYGVRNVASFSGLKNRMKDIMIKSLVVQSIHDDSENIRMDEITKSYRLILASKLLIYKKDTTLAVKLLERELNRSITFSFTESVLLCSRLLATNYDGVKRSSFKHRKYLDLQSKYFKIYKTELQAQNYFHELHRDRMNTALTSSLKVKNKALNYYNELETILDINTFNYNYDKFRILAIYYEFDKEYEKLIELCDTAINTLNSKELKMGIVDLNFEIRKIWALIQLGRYNEVNLLGLEKLKECDYGSNSWCKFTHYTAKSLLYSKEYVKAIKIVISVLSFHRYNRLSNYFKELFQTVLGYIHLLVNAGLAGDPQKLKEKLPEFRLAKFLNNTPIYSKDKRGINVSILLMHIGFLLQRRNHDAILDRIDSLNAYASRYLRRDDTFRSNCMIKMVVKMAKAGFHPIKTERYTADLRKQLSEVSLAGSGDNIEIEIIPFEVLWEIMMKAIQPQPRQSRKR